MDPRTVLITGCSTGIGRAVAIGLRERGYRVYASARQAQDVAELARLGFDALQLDLDSTASIDNAVRELLARSGGKLYALINNGAYGQPGAVEDLSRDTLRRQFETNLFGTQELTNRLLPVFRSQGGGHIIQMSSVLGLVSLAYRGAYTASKHALEALSDTMRLELRGTGIHVSLIEPGPITSRFRENANRAFLANIDREHSPHRDYYARVAKRLGGDRPLPFTLAPEAVLARVVQALETRRPRARYYVTFPTYLFAYLRRVLPQRWLDTLLAKASGGGSR